LGKGGRFGKYGELKRKDRLRIVRQTRDVPLKDVPSVTPTRRRKRDRRSSSITLHRGGIEDRSFIGNLSHRVFSGFGDYRGIVIFWLAQPAVTTVIAREHSIPLGFAMLRLRKGIMFNRNVGEVLAIAVTPEHQRRGIGLRLLTRIESLAREQGAKELRLTTAEINKVASDFFMKSGFTIQRTKDRYYPAGQRALEMSKRL
jgi:ribosomal protein S18 acetylase RimI-like enzyme